MRARASAALANWRARSLVATRWSWRKSYIVCIYREPLLASSVPSAAPSTSIYEQLPVDYQRLPVYYEPSSLHEHFESLLLIIIY